MGFAGDAAGRRVAVLVDGENIGPAAAPAALELAQAMGRVAVRRVYRNANMAREWEAQPGFLTVHTGDGRGKNAADIALAIEAVELALRGRADGFVLVSSDGDFTRLATWLRENGFAVAGVGSERASLTFRAACELFREVPLGRAATEAALAAGPKAASAATPARPMAPAAVSIKAADSGTDTVPEGLLRKLDAVLGGAGAEGWMPLSTLGVQMGQHHGVHIRQIGGTTWRDMLQRWPKRYELEAKGPGARVRLRRQPVQRGA